MNQLTNIVDVLVKRRSVQNDLRSSRGKTAVSPKSGERPGAHPPPQPTMGQLASTRHCGSFSSGSFSDPHILLSYCPSPLYTVHQHSRYFLLTLQSIKEQTDSHTHLHPVCSHGEQPGDSQRSRVSLATPKSTWLKLQACMMKEKDLGFLSRMSIMRPLTWYTSYTP